MIIVPQDMSDASGLDNLRSIFTSIGFKDITIADSETHDKMIAYTSQLAPAV